ncbi:hypothetical protein V6N11_063589 [Hibiscus sabdariffa]|uniref:RNase H type-1 domain-containing protein n=1 Tax=Hibiscus sabdariffa TaxID=183260 RepID=A0ABR1ZS50_9ROSI
MGVFTGLLCAWDNGLRHIVVELDSQEAASLLQKVDDHRSRVSIITHIPEGFSSSTGEAAAAAAAAAAAKASSLIHNGERSPRRACQALRSWNHFGLQEVEVESVSKYVTDSDRRSEHQGGSLMVVVALFVLSSSLISLPDPWVTKLEFSCIPATFESDFVGARQALQVDRMSLD